MVNQLKNRDKSAHDFAGLYLKIRIRIRIRIGIRKIAHSAIEFERIAPSPFSEGGGAISISIASNQLRLIELD